MKASIRDPAVLQALGPVDVAAYLRSKGWNQVRRIGDRGSAWTQSLPIGELEILLPLNREVGDFVARMADALKALEIAEKRSQLEILSDLTTTSADVVRIRTQQSDAGDGSIPLEEGVDLVQHARDLILAAACAAVQPRPYFHARKPAQAAEYMKQVRLGQTERGSYVITLLSRVPPNLEPTRDGQGRLEVEDPFERKVTRTLATALAAVRDAVQESIADGSSDAFQRAVKHGVSANLCEAVAALAGATEEPRDLEVDLTWSRLRPLDSGAPGRIRLPSNAIPVVREAGRVFRETTPRADFELVGAVIALTRTDPAQSGRVTVWGPVEGPSRRVNLDLTGTDYDCAVEAHKEGRLVRCLGHLVKDGKQFELRKPHCFELADEE